MNSSTIDKRLTESKPLRYVTIGGIILAILAFFLMIFLFLRFLFGLGAHAFAVAGFSANGNATSTGQAAGGFFSLPIVPSFSTSSPSTSTNLASTSRVHANYGHANYVYGIPVGSH